MKAHFVTEDKKLTRKVRNIQKLFKLLDKYDRVINENLVEPRYFGTILEHQDIIRGNILRLTKQIVDNLQKELT